MKMSRVTAYYALSAGHSHAVNVCEYFLSFSNGSLGHTVTHTGKETIDHDVDKVLRSRQERKREKLLWELLGD